MQTTTIEENKRIARRVPEEIATERNMDIVEEVFAEDFVEHGFIGQTIESREEETEQMKLIHLAFPDFEAEVLDIIGEDDTVAMRVKLSGTHKGPFMGIDPTDAPVDVRGNAMHRVGDGRIAETWATWNFLGVLQQIGAVEPPME